MKPRGNGRGRRLGLTRDKVIAAAVTMIEREGIDSFSLRRLATELDVEAMSLYNHVSNRDALLDGVAELLLAEVDFSGTDIGTWQDRVRAHAAAFRAAALRHPKAFPLVLTRPSKSPEALETIHSALTCFDELGLPPEELVHTLRSISAYIVGTIMRELGHSISLGTWDPSHAPRRIEELTATGDPLLATVAPYLAVGDHDIEYAYGIELLIAGIAARMGVPYDGGPRTATRTSPAP
ncbi:TetR/AcrR family transcriptional regulator C-terminal domain-containing protein [Streptomyces sp. NPDC048309]|uniref:TetR/AcrR family transcriptional regulator C-terminal domain-containing protein n=1 Tax=unclassified Streptomyces TaxID=2593676 RepID=UPI0033E17EF8